MKKNGHRLLTWDEMLKVEDEHPFFAGNLRSLRMGAFLVRPGRNPPRRSPARKRKPATTHG